MDKLGNTQILLYQDKLLNIETKEHVENVSRMCVFIAGKFDFTEEKIYNLSIISRFHDIGKIEIPIEILDKNGPLTGEEWSLIKQHPMMGRDILRNFGFRDEETTVVHQHHEKCDGSGYPLGLTCNEISFEAKILAIIDVMDALLSDRSYKKAWPVEKVRDFFEKNEEGFCEAVVDAIMEHFDELISLRI
jgi:HD-GYP domain-containing protein (c-di-GMP phosphodiesterase class II)